MAGGFAVKSKDVSLPPPSPTVASVKCTITPALTPKYVLDQVRGAVLKELQKRICSACMEIKSMYSKFKAYDDALKQLAVPVPKEFEALVADLAATLAVVADVESSGGATVYRVSDASIRRSTRPSTASGEPTTQPAPTGTASS